MNWAEFVRVFSEDQEIGRAATDDELQIFYDNGQQVGCVRQNRRTTEYAGEILGEADAAACRHWCKQQRSEAARCR